MSLFARYFVVKYKLVSINTCAQCGSARAINFHNSEKAAGKSLAGSNPAGCPSSARSGAIATETDRNPEPAGATVARATAPGARCRATGERQFSEAAERSRAGSGDGCRRISCIGNEFVGEREQERTDTVKEFGRPYRAFPAFRRCPRPFRKLHPRWNPGPQPRPHSRTPRSGRPTEPGFSR